MGLRNGILIRIRKKHIRIGNKFDCVEGVIFKWQMKFRVRPEKDVTDHWRSSIRGKKPKCVDVRGSRHESRGLCRSSGSELRIYKVRAPILNRYASACAHLEPIWNSSFKVWMMVSIAFSSLVGLRGLLLASSSELLREDLGHMRQFQGKVMSGRDGMGS